MQQTEGESSWARGRGTTSSRARAKLAWRTIPRRRGGVWANSHLGAGRCSLWLSRGLHSVYSVHSFGGKGGVQDAMLMGSGGGTDCGSQIQSQAWAKLRAGARASPAPSLVPVCGLAERPQVPTRQGDPPGSLRDQPRLGCYQPAITTYFIVVRSTTHCVTMLERLRDCMYALVL